MSDKVTHQVRYKTGGLGCRNFLKKTYPRTQLSERVRGLIEGMFKGQFCQIAQNESFLRFYFRFLGLGHPFVNVPVSQTAHKAAVKLYHYSGCAGVHQSIVNLKLKIRDPFIIFMNEKPILEIIVSQFCIFNTSMTSFGELSYCLLEEKYIYTMLSIKIMLVAIKICILLIETFPCHLRMM